MGRRLFLVTAAVICMTCLMWHMTVKAQDAKAASYSNAYYEELEEVYQELLRDKLDSMGFENAGITMTRVYREDGTREYTTLIHHRRIDRMTPCEQEELLQELSITNLNDEHCVFAEKFLAYSS